MKKELAKSLRHIRTHPQTGTAFNEQLLTTQVATIFALDKLKNEIKELKKTNVELSKETNKLQKVVLALTIVGVIIAIIEVWPTIEKNF